MPAALAWLIAAFDFIFSALASAFRSFLSDRASLRSFAFLPMPKKLSNSSTTTHICLTWLRK
jgi:hypothetical protein